MSKNINPKKPQVIFSIPSMFLPAIAASGSVTGFSDPDLQTYDFAQRVNKICCDFFRENMLVNDLVSRFVRNPNNEYADRIISVYDANSSDFWSFHKRVVSHFLERINSKLYGAFYDERLPLDERVCAILDECNNVKYTRDFFDKACDFYKSICLRMPEGRDIELRNKMEELINLLHARSFPVYIVFEATRSRLLDRDWGYETDTHSYTICKKRLDELNRGEYTTQFFNKYTTKDVFAEFNYAKTNEKWGVAVTTADTVINHDVKIPVSQARFFVRDVSSDGVFALKQMKLSEVLAKHVQENEDF